VNSAGQKGPLRSMAIIEIEDFRSELNCPNCEPELVLDSYVQTWNGMDFDDGLYYHCGSWSSEFAKIRFELLPRQNSVRPRTTLSDY